MALVVTGDVQLNSNVINNNLKQVGFQYIYTLQSEATPGHLFKKWPQM